MVNGHIKGIQWGDFPPHCKFQLDDNNKEEILPYPVTLQVWAMQKYLRPLLDGHCSRGIFADGMTDIDIWALRDGTFRIEVSPACHVNFEVVVDRSEIQELYDGLMSYNTKTK